MEVVYSKVRIASNNRQIQPAFERSIPKLPKVDQNNLLQSIHIIPSKLSNYRDNSFLRERLNNNISIINHGAVKTGISRPKPNLNQTMVAEGAGKQHMESQKQIPVMTNLSDTKPLDLSQSVLNSFRSIKESRGSNRNGYVQNQKTRALMQSIQNHTRNIRLGVKSIEPRGSKAKLKTKEKGTTIDRRDFARLKQKDVLNQSFEDMPPVQIRSIEFTKNQSRKELSKFNKFLDEGGLSSFHCDEDYTNTMLFSAYSA